MGVGINKNCGVGKSEKFSAHVLAVALYKEECFCFSVLRT